MTSQYSLSYHALIVDAASIDDKTPDDALVTIDAAAAFTDHSVGTLRQYRGEGKGPLSFLRSGRIVYRLGDLRAYERARYTASVRGGSLT
ncbi:hypothetical protein R3Q08_26330 [Rhodococcus erythropolis]|uniref:hypothetical protein n=1 Tax=Rhodococcus erythropolis TaxID=1833 RepID=UPI0029490D95|nr:hypothetical protein [Rhodococcus erythropolis]MDV6211788.1 hypothetical protein [Rhodococcus erythropolis]